MSEELKQEEYFVAFLDILGYSNHINSISKKESNEYLAVIKEALNPDNLFCTRQLSFTYKMPLQLEEFYQKHCSVRLFSDNILITVKCPQKQKDNLYIFLEFCNYVKNIQILFFSTYNILLRGGITKGLFSLDENFVFGEALIRAHELEQAAIYPRIIVEQNLIDSLFISCLTNKTMTFQFKNLIVRDNDVYFIHFMIAFFPEESSTMNTLVDIFTCYTRELKSNNTNSYDTFFLPLHRNLIHKIKKYGNYDKCKKAADTLQQQKIILKYLWLLDYYNICCSTLDCALSQKINYQIINDPIHHLPKIVLLEDEQEEQP